MQDIWHARREALLDFAPLLLCVLWIVPDAYDRVQAERLKNHVYSQTTMYEVSQMPRRLGGKRK